MLPGLFMMVSRLRKYIKIKAHGLLTLCTDIFIEPVAPLLILSYKLSNYSYHIDGCLGAFSLIRIFHVSFLFTKVRNFGGTFLLEFLMGLF